MRNLLSMDVAADRVSLHFWYSLQPMVYTDTAVQIGSITVIGVAKSFGWEGGQTTSHMQRRHWKFSKEELFVGHDIVEWRIRSCGLVCHATRILVKRES